MANPLSLVVTKVLVKGIEGDKWVILSKEGSERAAFTHASRALLRCMHINHRVHADTAHLCTYLCTAPDHMLLCKSVHCRSLAA
eukprot:scaffold128098_cov19-Tisochrysis_lutea.AAC.2